MIKKYKEFESEKYLSDEEIESGYNNYVITDFSIDRLFDDGGASGWITIEFPPNEECDDFGVESKTDQWIKYDSGPKIAFDSWYPSNVSKKLKEYIEEGIIKKKAEKYNI